MAFPFTDYDCLIADGAIRSGKTVFMMMQCVDTTISGSGYVEKPLTAL